MKFVIIAFALVSSFRVQAASTDAAEFDVNYLTGLARSFEIPVRLQELDAKIKFYIPKNSADIDVTDFSPNQSSRSRCLQVTKLPLHSLLPPKVKAVASSACGIAMLHVNYVYSANDNYFDISRLTISPMGNEMTGFLTEQNEIVGFEHKVYSAKTNSVTSEIDVVLPSGAFAHQTLTADGVLESSPYHSTIDILGANQSFAFTSKVEQTENGRNIKSRIAIPSIQQDEGLVIDDQMNEVGASSSCVVEVLRAGQVTFHADLRQSCNIVSNKAPTYQYR